jgi:hypothetical protein
MHGGRIMLGEMIGEEQGRITATRVLPFDGTAMKVEVSFQGSGTLVGVETTNMGTYISTLMPNGTYNGVGQGIVMTKDGEMLTWTGTGVGKPTGKGMAARWRGSLCIQTSSQRFAKLNEIATLFEYDVDENGNTTDKLWEWK